MARITPQASPSRIDGELASQSPAGGGRTNMRRRCERIGLVGGAALVGFMGLAGQALAAEPAPPPAPSGFVGWLESPVPANLPFRLTGEVDLGAQKLEGNRNSPNFRTYRVI